MDLSDAILALTEALDEKRVIGEFAAAREEPERLSEFLALKERALAS
jgi:hypothetical protein